MQRPRVALVFAGIVTAGTFAALPASSGADPAAGAGCAALRIYTRATWRPGVRAPVAVAVRGRSCRLVLSAGMLTRTARFARSGRIAFALPAPPRGAHVRLRACATRCAPAVEVRVRTRGASDPWLAGRAVQPGVNCSALRVRTRPSWRPGGREPVTIEVADDGTAAGTCVTRLFVDRVSGRTFARPRFDLAGVAVAKLGRATVVPAPTPGIVVPATAAGSEYAVQACATAPNESFPQDDCSEPRHVRVRGAREFAESVVFGSNGRPGVDCRAFAVDTPEQWRVSELNALSIVAGNHGTVPGSCRIALRIDALAGRSPQPLDEEIVHLAPSATTTLNQPLDVATSLTGARYVVQACATGTPVEYHPEDDCSPALEVPAIVDPIIGTWAAGATTIDIQATSPTHFVAVATAWPASSDPCATHAGDEVYDITAPSPATGAYTATVFERASSMPGGPCVTTLRSTTLSVADTGDHWTLVGAGSLTRAKR